MNNMLSRSNGTQGRTISFLPRDRSERTGYRSDRDGGMNKHKETRSYRLDAAVVERLEWLAGQSRRSKSSMLELLIINAKPGALGVPRRELEDSEGRSPIDG